VRWYVYIVDHLINKELFHFDFFPLTHFVDKFVP
jgi:hypothetical protein